ncbi:hypothetical protein [Clostridium sporogenes]|uniref:hypothetical protein n=1 Tax=Clostridium sporogenes TaxID=1509 RepID=UPI0013D20FBA|nr:hypothetical protein [Clostridium sporogenes]MCW6124295.1 hypothetical protein [Clostridium sporogenes]NFT27042.1 hypothetical protein [Clostridium sporogenes]
MRYVEKIFEIKDFENKVRLPFLINKEINDSEYIYMITIKDSLNSYIYGKSINGALTVKELDVLLAMINIFNYSSSKKRTKQYNITFSTRELLLNMKKAYTIKNINELKHMLQTINDSFFANKRIIESFTWNRTNKDDTYYIKLNSDIFEYYYLKVYKKIDYNKYSSLVEKLSGKLYIHLLYNPILEEYNKNELIQDMLIVPEQFALIENALYELRWNGIIENFVINKDFIIIKKII